MRDAVPAFAPSPAVLHALLPVTPNPDPPASPATDADSVSYLRPTDPRRTGWTPADLARRRALAVARSELEAAQLRQDGRGIERAWRNVADELARVVPDGGATPSRGNGNPRAWHGGR